MFDELKKSFEAKWAWAMVVVGVGAAAVPEIQSTIADAVPVLGDIVDSGIEFVKDTGAKLAALWLTVGSKFRAIAEAALARIKKGA